MSPTLSLIESLMLVHILAGLLCLVAGSGALLTQPKGGKRHRWTGRAFLWMILVLALTAGGLLVFRWNAFFFALSVFSFYLAFSGWRVLKRKHPESFPEQCARPTDWIAAVVAVITGAGSIGYYATGGFGPDSGQAAVVLGTLAFAALAALYDLWRFAFPRALGTLAPRSVRGVWLLEHLTKLSGAFMALACAFSGTVWTTVPVAFAQTAPAILGTPLLLYVTNRYWRRMRSRSAP